MRVTSNDKQSGGRVDNITAGPLDDFPFPTFIWVLAVMKLSSSLYRASLFLYMGEKIWLRMPGSELPRGGVGLPIGTS